MGIFVEQHKRISFPKELFDDLVDEAIDDLCQTGLDPKEIDRILESFLGIEIAGRYVEHIKIPVITNNKTITPDSTKGEKTN
jgi:hypothetical protein